MRQQLGLSRACPAAPCPHHHSPPTPAAQQLLAGEQQLAAAVRAQSGRVHTWLEVSPHEPPTLLKSTSVEKRCATSRGERWCSSTS